MRQAHRWACGGRGKVGGHRGAGIWGEGHVGGEGEGMLGEFKGLSKTIRHAAVYYQNVLLAVLRLVICSMKITASLVSA